MPDLTDYDGQPRSSPLQAYGPERTKAHQSS
jgi:hypothetical protein